MKPKHPNKTPNRLNKLSELEQSLLKSGIKYLAGVDEVGRGCLAGPVVAACVILPLEGWGIPNGRGNRAPTLADSKTLSPKTREQLSKLICAQAFSWSLGTVDPEEIDRINIHNASLLAMEKAVKNLSQKPDYILIDGRFKLGLNISQQAVIDGDAKCQIIAAASIIAKVWRDDLMTNLQDVYPSFQFSKHKGYGTQKHREELKLYGPTEIHRKTFRGVNQGDLY